jgi:hypothetical protein
MSLLGQVIDNVCRLVRVTARCFDSHAVPRRGAGNLPDDVVVYEGRIYLQPADEYGEGNIMLVGEGNLVDYLYRHLDIPAEDRAMVQVNLYGRITVEAFDDPERNWWPF